MHWTIAKHNTETNKVVMLFDLMHQGKKINNSFKTHKEAQKVIDTNSLSNVMIIQNIDSGITYEAYKKHYPIKKPSQPTRTNTIKRSPVPDMVIKEHGKTIETIKVEPTVKTQSTPKPTAKPKQENKPTVKPQSTPKPTVKPKQESKPTAKPKQENKPQNKVPNTSNDTNVPSKPKRTKKQAKNEAKQESKPTS